MRNLLTFFVKTILDPEEALEEARSETRPGASNAPRVVLVVLIAVGMAVIMTVLAVKYPDIDFDGG